MKNKLIVIGFIGDKKCYFNVSREEAIERYKKSEFENDYVNYDLEEIIEIMSEDEFVEELEFDDEFECYEIYGSK